MVKKCIVYSVPKSGTHFVSQILALLINPNCNIYDKDSLYKIVPHAMSTKLANLPFYNTHPMYIPYNIIKNAFKILNAYSYKYEVWLGPAISKKYYIVDMKVKNLFKNINKDYEEFFTKNHFNNDFNMDLVGIASFQLIQNNVDNIFYSNLCTAENNDDFYSHRYSSSEERFGTFVWIK